MKKISLIIVIFILFSCQNIDIEKEKLSLIEADKNFSTLSEKEGMQKAFLRYIDDDGVLLRDNSMPIIGIEKLSELYNNKSDTGFILTWEPLFADISSSLEIGYTYGIWTYKADSIIEKGTYVTIWKKNDDGTWKFVLDTGNDGLD
jgi:ketosteroid isomerase-like protein